MSEEAIEETVERDYEAEAKEQGWNPDYEGPNKADAKTFVEKGEKITGILKSRVDRLEQTAAELRAANKEFGEYQKQLREKDKKAAEERIAQLEALRATAITDGDGQEYNRVDREIAKARQSIQPENVNTEVALEQEWAANNQWYGRDLALTAFADGVTAMVEAEGYNGKARLDEIARRTRETFPQKFENPKRNASNGVESGGEIETGNSKAHKYENLPPEAKAACDRFVTNGLMSKSDYVKNFEWEE